MEKQVESLNLEFLPSESAVTVALRACVAKDWAIEQIAADQETEGKLWNLSK